MKMQNNPVLVEWIDAIDQENGWIPQELAKKANVMTVISVGFIFNETDEFITLIADKDKNPNEDSEVSRVTTIPKACIKKTSALCVESL